MSIPTTPGVIIREIASGARSIAGAPTSIAAFVGGFARGPLNTPMRMFTQGDFSNIFGGVSADWPTSFAVSQFFINGGGQSWAVRVSPNAEAASVTIQSVDGNAVLRATAGIQVAGVSRDDPGEHGNNLRLDVDYRTADPATQFNLSVSEIRVNDGIEQAVRTEIFRNLTITAGPQNALAVVNDGSSLVQLSRDGGWPEELPAATGYYSDAITPANLAAVAAGDYDLTLDLGTGAQPVTATFAAPPATVAAAASALQGAIRNAYPADRLFAQATVTAEGDRIRIAGGRSSPDWNASTVIAIADVGPDTLVATLNLDAASASANVEQYSSGATLPAGFVGAVTAGDDGDPADAAELRGDRGARTGFYALDDAGDFNMLLIPEASDLGDTADLSSVMAAALTYCIEKRAMLFIDPPAAIDTIPEAENWLEEIANAGLRSGNSVSYYPRVRVPNPDDDNRLITVAPSGSVAGIWARTDGAVGVWKAPAGTTASLRNAPALDHVMTDAENGIINPLGLNALRNFSIPGNVVWGARTLNGADRLAIQDSKYVPVRRMALFVESSLFDGLQWAVFQPNASPLWTEIRAAVTSFMQQLFRQGAFQGNSPSDAFIVRCGPDTTTQADINAGIVNVFVGFAPLQPAEFVIVSLQLQLQAAQAA
ncbi:phage tail sheath subtilisin-like domain-containing protein [Paracoccus sp. MBLB3053]|uniref:Phage tail sheath subtilisin-like domain-containing protein n=1 Tax=Paracoccus aurantius TaxID=3073814 RepID=A0ABU2HYL0_9RHOB|nr:phage tail sheath subtilisin-like domain-containing protein [Paracoccus sp. MBLB3053]MDS9470141.1 phage tail sheath subtilisin-like domain-containing protein [Paracoccus sp. MBLB3053]